MQISPSMPLLTVPALSVQPKSGPSGGGTTPAAEPAAFSRALQRAEPIQVPPQSAMPEPPSVRPTPAPPQEVPPQGEDPQPPSIQPTPAPPRQRRTAAVQGQQPRQLPRDTDSVDKRSPQETPATGNHKAGALGVAGAKARHAQALADEKAKPQPLPPVKPEYQPLPAELETTAPLDDVKAGPPTPDGDFAQMRPAAPVQIPMQPEPALAAEGLSQPIAGKATSSGVELPSSATAASALSSAQQSSTASPPTGGAGHRAAGFERQAMLEAAQAAQAARSSVPPVGSKQDPAQASPASDPGSNRSFTRPLASTQTDSTAAAASPVAAGASAGPAIPTTSAPSAAAVVADAAATPAEPAAAAAPASNTGPAASFKPVARFGDSTHLDNDSTGAGRRVLAEAAVAQLYRAVPDAGPTSAAVPAALTQALPVPSPNAPVAAQVVAGGGKRQTQGEAQLTAAPGRSAVELTGVARSLIVGAQFDPAQRPQAQPPSVWPQALPPSTSPQAQPPSVSPQALPPSTGPQALPPSIGPQALPPSISPQAQPPSVWPQALPPSLRPQPVPPQLIPAAATSAEAPHAEAPLQASQPSVLVAGNSEVVQPTVPSLPDTGQAASQLASVGWNAVGAYQAAQAAVPTEAFLPASPGSADFAPQLGKQITTFVRDGIEHAQLHLNPAEMGPVSVRIQLDGQVAQVHLSADHALTRQALEASMPQLASQLSEAGLTLGGGGVFEQPRQGRDAASQDAAGEARRQDRADDTRDRGQSQPAPALPPMRRGVVDLVA